MLMVNGSGEPEDQRSQKILGLEAIRFVVPHRANDWRVLPVTTMTDSLMLATVFLLF
jgi:hypothetical protein